MPWRDDTRPYHVLVSEMMLQQTQVSRVVPKFDAFIEQFCDETALAQAPLSEVIAAWQGLGYNRRAKYLHDAATMITTQCGGRFPDTAPALQQLPGVGPNTAGAIMAYAFNQPSIFIETNIRTVYIHHFFEQRDDVHDREIVPLLEATLDRAQPRLFYWALMDYGAHLKSTGAQHVSRSRHYKKQSALRGSVREMRGQIITQLTRAQSLDALQADPRYRQAIDGLLHDGLIRHDETGYALTG